MRSTEAGEVICSSSTSRVSPGWLPSSVRRERGGVIISVEDTVKQFTAKVILQNIWAKVMGNMGRPPIARGSSSESRRRESKTNSVLHHV